MVGKRKRSAYRKARKRLGFPGVQKQSCFDRQTSSNNNVNSRHFSELSDNNINETQAALVENPTPISASRRKLSKNRSPDAVDGQIDQISGPKYRLVDIQKLSSAVFNIHKCEEGIKSLDMYK